MTGIEGVGWPIAPRAATRARMRSQFSVPSEPADAGNASAVVATQATPLMSMLNLQEFAGETIEDREAHRHGHDLLAALADLQRALLGAGGDTAALQRLADLAGAVPYATDRRLAALVAAIVLRVRVELARRQV